MGLAACRKLKAVGALLSMSKRSEHLDVIIASPPDRENLTAEIYDHGRFVALVSREPEEKAFQVDIQNATVNAKEFDRALKTARKELSSRRLSYYWSQAVDFSKSGLAAIKEVIEKVERFFHWPTTR
jgi:hypothetical protein